MMIYDIYKDILSENARWNCTPKEDIDHDISKLFSLPESYNFMMSLLFWDSSFHELGIKLYHKLKKIPEERLSHTVSLYLLGIAVCEKIGYDVLNLPKYDKNPKKSFLHHWLGVCLFHDYGYYIENNKKDYPVSEFKTIDDVINKLKITYDLRDTLTESDKALIEKYYSYRINERHKKIDHGIISALTMYDVLMLRNEKMTKIAETAIMFYDNKPYGKEFIENAIKYSCEIVKHNMWFAYKDTVDKYKDYELYDLIPKSDGSHRYKISETPGLFLLSLLDTFEPTKRYGIESLKKISINVLCKNGKTIISISSKYNDLYEKIKDCENWLELVVNKKDDESFEIVIQF